eukprot:TRINITY_DN66953_c7_g1_i1.p1 TRINITY_DN66953_c7_g1~~TRINITY_DN66953_c7_g1_i1.p1  ORF type:complete len:1014 (-),score=70.61 TRINITY_DN66953_c7_g1_i1:1027-4068(-)
MPLLTMAARGETGRQGRKGTDGVDGVAGMCGGKTAMPGGHGSHGSPGSPGGDGTDGGDGENGAFVRIEVRPISYCKDTRRVQLAYCGSHSGNVTISPSCPIFEISARGAPGGKGGNGGRGGAGGLGGRGGTAGTPDAPRGKPSSALRGGNGGNGGAGGPGGNGGRGGRGGDGGEIRVRTRGDYRHLAFIRASVTPGTGGLGGGGGVGGAGGAGGAAGLSGDSNQPSYNGKHGTTGKSGETGRDGVRGRSGRDGRITFEVQGEHGDVQQSSPTCFSGTTQAARRIDSPLQDGILQPGQRIQMSHITIGSSGGLHIPEGIQLHLIAEDEAEVVGNSYCDLPVIQTSTSYVCQDPFCIQLPTPPITKNSKLCHNVKVHSRLTVWGYELPGSRCVNVLKLQYPICLQTARWPTVLTAGGEVTVTLHVHNISKVDYGGTAELSKQVAIEVHCTGQASLKGAEGHMVHSLPVIASNGSHEFSVCLTATDGLKSIEACKLTVLLRLADKVIEHHEHDIRVVPTFRPRQNQDCLLVTGPSVTKEEFSSWMQVLSWVGIDAPNKVDLFDVEVANLEYTNQQATLDREALRNYRGKLVLFLLPNAEALSTCVAHNALACLFEDDTNSWSSATLKPLPPDCGGFNGFWDTGVLLVTPVLSTPEAATTSVAKLMLPACKEFHRLEKQGWTVFDWKGAFWGTVRVPRLLELGKKTAEKRALEIGRGGHFGNDANTPGFSIVPVLENIRPERTAIFWVRLGTLKFLSSPVAKKAKFASVQLEPLRSSVPPGGNVVLQGHSNMARAVLATLSVLPLPMILRLGAAVHETKRFPSLCIHRLPSPIPVQLAALTLVAKDVLSELRTEPTVMRAWDPSQTTTPPVYRRSHHLLHLLPHTLPNVCQAVHTLLSAQLPDVLPEVGTRLLEGLQKQMSSPILSSADEPHYKVECAAPLPLAPAYLFTNLEPLMQTVPLHRPCDTHTQPAVVSPEDEARLAIAGKASWWPAKSVVATAAVGALGIFIVFTFRDKK